MDSVLNLRLQEDPAIVDLEQRLDGDLSDFHQRLLLSASEAGNARGLFTERAAAWDDAASLCWRIDSLKSGKPNFW